MNNLYLGLFVSHLLIGCLVWLITDHILINKFNTRLESHNKFYQSLLDDDKQIIDELNRLLVEIHEQSNKVSSDNAKQS